MSAISINKRRRAFGTRALMAMAAGALILPTTTSIATAHGSPTPFERVWERADLPVATGHAARSWLWGPQVLTTTAEPMAESPGGMRQVQYYDKSRMEINDPNGDPNSPWYVTNGLLVVEMVSGRLQLGVNTFRQLAPAQEQVAGDTITMGPGGPAKITPTYADLARVATLGPGQNEANARTGQEVREILNPDGTVRQGPPDVNGPLPRDQYYEPVTHHNIPDVFISYMNQQGTVYENGQYKEGQVLNWIYAMGYPITEPYWITIEINGNRYPVMMQAFQRRLLTYNPANVPQWRVEMGNVGMQYYQWRYGALPVPPPNPVPKPGTELATRRFAGQGLNDPRQFSGIHQELYTVVTNDQDWMNLWVRHLGPLDRVPNPPAVTFSHEFVVAAFWGDKPNGCYMLNITNVLVKERVITVNLSQIQKTGACAQVIVQPYDLLAVETTVLSPATYKVNFVANGSQIVGSVDAALP